MSRIALMLDSSADITREQAQELGFYVLRMPVTVDGRQYLEGETITEKDVVEALENKLSVKTAQPIVGDMIAMWKELLEDHDEVFYLPITNGLSGTGKTASILAQQFDGKVTVVQSEFVCYPAVVVMQMAKALFEQGYTTSQVKEKIEKEGELFAVIIPETLDALKAGGRISAAAAAVAGLLKIVPLLNVKHGTIDLEEKVRTHKKAYQRGLELVVDGVDPQDYEWMVIDAFDQEKSDMCKKMLEEATGQPVQQRAFRTIILSHVGKGTVAFGRIKKLK